MIVKIDLNDKLKDLDGNPLLGPKTRIIVQAAVKAAKAHKDGKDASTVLSEMTKEVEETNAKPLTLAWAVEEALLNDYRSEESVRQSAHVDKREANKRAKWALAVSENGVIECDEDTVEWLSDVILERWTTTTEGQRANLLVYARLRAAIDKALSEARTV